MDDKNSPTPSAAAGPWFEVLFGETQAGGGSAAYAG